MTGNARMRAIRNWLLQQPRPHSVRVTSGDEEHTIEVGHQKWAAIATSIEALEPDKIEALDEKVKLLRAVRTEQLEVSTDADDDTPVADKKEAKRAEREATVLATALATANAELMRTFAGHIADAYKHSTSVAFDKLCEVANIFARRGDSLEKSLASTERLLRRAYEEAAEAAGGDDAEPSLVESVVNALAGGIHQGKVEAAVKKTNGKVPQI